MRKELTGFRAKISKWTERNYFRLMATYLSLMIISWITREYTPADSLLHKLVYVCTLMVLGVYLCGFMLSNLVNFNIKNSKRFDIMPWKTSIEKIEFNEKIKDKTKRLVLILILSIIGTSIFPLTSYSWTHVLFWVFVLTSSVIIYLWLFSAMQTTEQKANEELAKDFGLFGDTDVENLQ